MKNIKAGFTLAEVLVTLGIIGVVAAMTIPTLISNHQTKGYVTSLQKVYAEITQALKMKLSDEGVTNLNDANLSGHEGEFLKSYFKYVKECENDLDPCFAYSYKTMDGGYVNFFSDPAYSIVLASGAAIGIRLSFNEVGFFIDTNGPAKPNVYGKDFHYFDLDSQGKLWAEGTIWYLARNGWVMDEDYFSRYSYSTTL